MKKQLVIAILSLSMTASLLSPAAVYATEETPNATDFTTSELPAAQTDTESTDINDANDPEKDLTADQEEEPTDPLYIETSDDSAETPTPEQNASSEETTIQSDALQDNEAAPNSPYAFTCTKDADQRTITIKTAKSHTSMHIAVWTETNGQDDLHWYELKQHETGVWTTTFSNSDLKHNGHIFIHLYTFETGTPALLGEYDIDTAENAPKLQEISISTTGKSRTVTVVANSTEYTSMKIAVWSDTNGQDDLKWLNMTQSSSDRRVWKADIDLSILKHEGLAHFHVYTEATTFLGKTTETFAAEDINAFSFACSENADKRTITIKTTEPHASMHIAVWTETNGQDDLHWYELKQKESGVWTTDFSTSDLKHNGHVFIHLYTFETGTPAFLGKYDIDIAENAPKLQEITMSSTGNPRTVTVVANSTAYTNMRVAIWSNTNGQDDLKWYTMKQSSTDKRIWNTSVPLQNIKHPGLVCMHVYTDTATFLGKAETTLDESEFPKNDIQISGNAGSRTITVSTESTYSDMRVAVWSAENSQDDLIWYNLKKNSDGKWTASLNMENLLHSGVCYAHVYSGSATLVGTADFNCDPSEITRPRITISGSGSSRSINLTGSGPHTSVKAAVWSATSGQDDLVWYDMKKESTKSWSLNYPLSSLKHSGTCYVHIYADNKIVAGTTFTISDNDYFNALQTYGFGSNIDFVRCALNIARNDSIGYGHTWPATISCAGLVGLSLTYCGYGDFIKDDPLGWGYIDLGPEYERELVTTVGCQVLNGPWTKYNFNQLLPGDILYYYISDTNNHVGIYLGDGMTVEARGPHGATDIDDNKYEVAVYNIYNDPSNYQRVYRIPANKIHYIQ